MREKHSTLSLANVINNFPIVMYPKTARNLTLLSEKYITINKISFKIGQRKLKTILINKVTLIMNREWQN